MPRFESAHISGTLDYAGHQFEFLEHTYAQILQTFASYGYVQIELPILQRADTFLERSGEEIRRRIYAFNDPTGRELCLRPELTIPACRFFLQELYQPNVVARLSYFGPVFRY